MKKIFSTLFAFLLIMVFALIPSSSVTANAASDGIPYVTYTLGTNNRLVQTQAAYVPHGVFTKEDVQLDRPSDMFLFEDKLYIANTGQKNIVVLDNKGNLIEELTLTNEAFVSPTGVFVTSDYIYVADKDAKAVFKYNVSTKTFEEPIGRPTEVMFGSKTPYVPTKICVAPSGLMYIVSEGCTNGVVTINRYGEFMGFVGINTTTFSLRKYIYNFFVSGDKLANQKPSAPTNVTIGANGNIFTTNVNINEVFKRLNISGQNTLGSDTYYPSFEDGKDEISDITISDDNYIYLSSKNGNIYEYDSTGKLLFTFSTKDQKLQRVLGLTAGISSIEIDSSGNIYVLDNQYNNIQIYERTAFVNILHKAVDMYNDGQYLQSKPLWESVLKENSNFALAHTALGWSYYKENNYDEALNEFYLSKNYKGYSDVYWEIRNEFLQQYTGYIILAVVVLLVLLKVGKKLLYKNALVDEDGKKISPLSIKVKEKYNSKEHSKFVVKSVALLKEVKYGFRILRHPSDTFYGIKRQHKASYSSALFVLVLFLITYCLSAYASAFLFKDNGSVGSAISSLIVIIAVFTLWCVVNYLIATLNDGEGWFKDIFITSCYCLIPFIIIKIPMVVVSYALTYNESFIMSIANIITYAWCGILLLLGILNIHNYSFKETLKNVIITIFAMALIALTLFLVYMFMSQLIDFIVSIIKEVFIRV